MVVPWGAAREVMLLFVFVGRAGGMVRFYLGLRPRLVCRRAFGAYLLWNRCVCRSICLGGSGLRTAQTELLLCPVTL